MFDELWAAGEQIAVPLMGLRRIYAMLDGTVFGVRRDGFYNGFHAHWVAGEAGWEPLTTWVQQMRDLLEESVRGQR